MAKTGDSKPTLSEAEKSARRAKNAANRARREARAAEKAARNGAAPETPRASATPSAANPNGGSVTPPRSDFNILVVAQSGRLEYEALLLAESLRLNAPGLHGRLIVAEPQPQAAWAGHDTQLSRPARAALEARGAVIRPFVARHFGAAYPYGNKIEALSALPKNKPFLFLDTDTLVTGDLGQVEFDFARPSASMRREGTWPKPPLYGPGYAQIWRSLYDRFGLDFESSLDLSQPDEHWERFLYFNAGWFFGAEPGEFRRRFLDWAREIKKTPGDALAVQSLDPWLDQITLPLVIHSFAGGRPGPDLDGLDGEVTCHWRNLPLLYGRESDRVVEVLEQAAAAEDLRPILRKWEPAQKLIYDGIGRRELRPAIDRAHLPFHEQPVRQAIKQGGWWLT
ncbi:hypothetical protein SAMN05421538_10649 [Paracoccus isoporae]|uniref:Glycosyl transferase family 8 n=1 Tax=Paracoccus isoporae TaxID=591205 RepID=A0A1G7CBL9_9RHOB|nr:hypothetical protein [Paracoccus isoporae]SDE36738.1 hypothetical protein SAMN05421538_10649 [Paracoccus isoporae]